MSSKLKQFIKEEILPPSERQLYSLAERPWYPVRLLALYRLFIAVLLSGTFFSGLATNTLGVFQPVLFSYCAIIYLALSILWLVLLWYKHHSYFEQVYLQIGSDIILLVLMMYASGGLGSGLGILLVVNIGGAALIISGLAGLFFASLATILILFMQVYTHWQIGFADNNFQQVGALCAAYFGLTVVMLVLKRRVQESEQLAEQRELDLENLAQLNEQIIQHMQSGVLVVDNTAKVRLINRSAKLQLGINEYEPPFALSELSPELVSRFNLCQNDTQQLPSRIRFPGSPFELQPYFTPLGALGEAGTLIVLEDMTPYSREFQNIKLTSLGRLTASIAHEIRNPLSAIQHAAQLLGESAELVAADQRLTEIIGQQTLRVNKIIENVLQISVKEKTEPTQIRLETWLHGFVKEYASQHTKFKYQIKSNVDATNGIIHFDPTQLHQILWNLCSNGMKYGRSADNEVSVDLLLDLDSESKSIYLDVADHGAGVEVSMRDKIFEPFFSGGNTSSGLGLYIVRELCEFNQASIRYTDIPDYGAVFRIQFSNIAPLNSENN